MAGADDENPYGLIFAEHEYRESETWMKADETTTTYASTSEQQQQQEQCNHQAQQVQQHSWTKALLLDCARAVAEDDTPRIQSLMWSLNENASPYGDCDQRLAWSFVQALVCRLTGTGARCLHSLGAAAEKTFRFESMRTLILEFQEASPWTTFGHVAGNGSLLEAMEGESRIHIVDISSTFCTQWPTFLEALATRTDETPHVRLTSIVISSETAALAVMQQITTRLHRFARLMGVPFQSCVLQQPALDLADFDLALLNLRDDEALAINCIQTLHHVDNVNSGSQASRLAAAAASNASPAAVPPDPSHHHHHHHPYMSPRDRLLSTFRSAKPKMLIIVEDEANLVWPADFVSCFGEALRFYSLFFESLEGSFPRASNERLMLERSCARKLVHLLSCTDDIHSDAAAAASSSSSSSNYSSSSTSILPERQETGLHWDARLRHAGFEPAPFSADVVDDVQALLKRYKKGWGLDTVDNRLYLTWKEHAVICSTAWKLITSPSP